MQVLDALTNIFLTTIAHLISTVEPMLAMAITSSFSEHRVAQSSEEAHCPSKNSISVKLSSEPENEWSSVSVAVHVVNSLPICLPGQHIAHNFRF